MIEIYIQWIIFGLMLVIILILLVKYLKNTLSYFGKMDYSSVVMKPLKIPSGEIEMNAKLILPKYALDKDGNSKTKLPLIFLNHGWNQYIDIL